MTTITIMRPDQEPDTQAVDLPERPSFEQLRTIIAPLLDGGMERVRVFWEGAYTDMFVDDRGLTKGLAINTKATEVYRNNVLTHEPGTDPHSLPMIFGPAVLFSRPVWF